MKHWARMAAAAYAFAILLASAAPHCAAMFGAAQAATPAAHTGDAHHAMGHEGHDLPAKAPAPDCAAMELANYAGPLPIVLTPPVPDVMALPPTDEALPVLAAPSTVEGALPRGPPRTAGGYAAIFAITHRLTL
jgi:hypothetical protein